jgi:septal ring factor EnvC (AmiA/AmiB activator)
LFLTIIFPSLLLFSFLCHFILLVALQMAERDLSTAKDRLANLESVLKTKRAECARCENELTEVSSKIVGLSRHYQTSVTEHDKLVKALETFKSQTETHKATAEHLKALSQTVLLKVTQAHKEREELEKCLTSEKERTKHLTISLGKVQLANAQLAEDYANHHSRFCVLADGTNTDRRVLEGISSLEYGKLK